ncbi:hypothetical protein DRP53_00140 [candidate division WOR-3 bacterium]|uniref:VCBS repeat-containing protein n=1 Tax=candidate division WOR-3 bacterium TaxID=2052148 RepID=A0A660SP05_UNCW3|nr:MAG: hypothetical protein DRP53_00140 [candidate division WOR-3 bacterium]
MRRVVLFSLVIVPIWAQAPRFYAPETLKSSGANIDVGYYGAPFIYDWDGDGKKDLVTGQFTSGKVRFYRNVGLNNNPIFMGYEYLKADGKDITVYSG